jgi:16S rRNA (uracil1498-N3)-methyltransferase
MKLHRFFIKDTAIGREEINIEDEILLHQMKNVLRLSENDQVIFIDQSGNEYTSTLKKVMKKNWIFSKENMKKSSRKNEINFVLYPSVIKKDKLEYVLQKCTEIGVSEFCPLVSDRTEKLNFNMKRAETIIREAAEQSEKNHLPSVSSPCSFSELVAKHETGKIEFNSETSFYLDIEAPLIDVSLMREIVVKQSDIVNFFVGPEGGWSDKDREMFDKIGVKPVSLGDTVLRAETASIAVASLLLLGHE